MLTLGVDLYTVSKLLGHSKIETTQIYAKIINKKKDDAVNLIDEMFDKA
jgi:site-specific recombinase XerD